ncbi:hypothetical protein AJ88_18715 [Mesorhizobium amorphae CCBAU 01583]|nr:hypothetical protein AJ88_18715 [Mesorhizobium amorphae CCBAU 01583]
MGLNIDAEEADRLDLSLDVIERVLAEPELAGWNGFGVVVQAYGPRAAFVIDWLDALAKKYDRTIMVRLVKGAYWDTEIKRAQTLGLDGYPVFTRKANTDVSYMACAKKLLSMTDRIYPQFATHNAHTVAAILSMATNRDAFEFQRLHGMGEALHETVRQAEGTRCRIYAPVGAHSDLLAFWSAGCWRTAPTPLSSTSSPMRRSSRRISPATHWKRSRSKVRPPIRLSPGPLPSSVADAATPGDSISPIR